VIRRTVGKGRLRDFGETGDPVPEIYTDNLLQPSRLGVSIYSTGNAAQEKELSGCGKSVHVMGRDR
jgi:hypothetical protein